MHLAERRTRGRGRGREEREKEGISCQLTHLTRSFDDRLIVASQVQTEKVGGHRFLPSLLLDQHCCSPEVTLEWRRHVIAAIIKWLLWLP